MGGLHAQRGVGFDPKKPFRNGWPFRRAQQSRTHRRPVLDTGLGFFVSATQESLTPCRARGDEVELVRA